jgi:hypothetical protein
MDPPTPVSVDPPAPAAQNSYSLDSAGLPVSPPAPPAPVENPVWNGWDVLLIAALTFVTMIVLQLAVLFAAHRFWSRERV